MYKKENKKQKNCALFEKEKKVTTNGEDSEIKIPPI